MVSKLWLRCLLVLQVVSVDQIPNPVSLTRIDKIVSTRMTKETSTTPKIGGRNPLPPCATYAQKRIDKTSSALASTWAALQATIMHQRLDLTSQINHKNLGIQDR